MNWEEVEFSQVVESSAFGPRFSGRNYADDGNVAALRTTDMSESGTICYETMPLARLEKSKFEKHFLEINDIVISRSGRIGTTGIFEGFDIPVLPGAFLIRFRLRKSVNPLFFKYFFNSHVGKQRLLSIARGAAQQNITSTSVLKLPVPFPKRYVQDEITSILSSYDDLIDNNNRRIALLEESVHRLYREWFVHLRFPGHERVTVRDGVPEGWKKGLLDQALLLQRGFDLPKRKRKLGTVPIYASTGINGFHNVAKVKGPGIVTGRSGTLGTVMYVHGDFWPLNTALWVKEFRKVTVTIAYFLLSNMDLSSYRGGAAVPTLNRNAVHAVEILLPTEALQAQFDSVAVPVLEQTQLLTRYNQQLCEARDRLLPRLMNGTLTP